MRLEIGVVSRPHGVRGELRVHLHNAESTAFDCVDEVYLAGVRYELVSARMVKGAVLLRLEGLDDRNAVESLRSAPVEVLRDQLELQEDDLLLSDLVGCRVQLEDGSDWGEIVEVVTGHQDRLVIHSGDTERHLPLVSEFLIDIDLESKVVVAAPPEGLPEWPR